jgi:hypothetical protein
LFNIFLKKIILQYFDNQTKINIKFTVI